MRDGERPSMEAAVVQAISLAPKSPEVWDEERDDDQPPISELEAFLENMTAIVKRHGVVIAHLAVVPETQKELLATMPDAVERIPAWLEAEENGPALMTPRLFVRGMAQLMGEQREAISRVVADQVLEPRPIEASLAAAPLPAGTEDEDNGEMIAALSEAIGAHMNALVEIARDLDEQMAPKLDRAESSNR
jgi:hypothetical protein